MKNRIILATLLFVSALITSCNKEPYQPADLISTQTYRIFNPKYTAEVMPGIFEMYVYYEYDMLTTYSGIDYTGCAVESITNFDDNTDDEAYRFTFDRNIDGVSHNYSVTCFKERIPVTEEDEDGNSTSYYPTEQFNITITNLETEAVTIYDTFIEVNQIERCFEEGEF